jgi:TonB-linked SusC/RagA family outer membrane protein
MKECCIRIKLPKTMFMERLSKLLWMAFLVFTINTSWAQQSKVTGRVTDNSGVGIPGATVIEKGTSNGTITDGEGRFSLNAENGVTFVFSFVGMTTQEILYNGQSEMNVTLLSDAIAVDEVVVTALGIKRDKKALGYAFQDVKADELNQTGDGVITSALEGKVAGVQISQSAGGVGSSTRIEIRGISSLTGNDNPLWVVDGVPFDDGNTSEGGVWGGISRAGGAFDLDPSNIESISVLKGPNAAALYGERGGNGVILVTTKKGSRSKGLGVTYSGNVTFSEAAYFLNYQNRYGQGVNGEYDKNALSSWGPEFNGQMFESWTGELIPYEAQKNRLKDFTRTGVSQKHNLAFSAGNDDGSYRVSIGNDVDNGIYEGNKIEKLTFDLNADYDINKWLNIDTKISYFKTVGKERPGLGNYSIMNYYVEMPRNIRNEDLAPGYNIIGGKKVEKLYTTAGPDYRNPYFLQETITNTDEKNRMFGFAAATLKLLPGLTAKLKYGLDFYRFGWVNGTLYEDNVSPNNPEYTTTEKYFKEDTYEYLISYIKDFNEKWEVSASFGGSVTNNYSEELYARSGKLASAGDFFLANGLNIQASESIVESEVRSMYGFGRVAYNNMLFLDVTARNDWSSTLTARNVAFDNSYFYPSVGLSAILSDAFELPEFVSFAKLRTSWARLGKATTPYATSQDYTVGPIWYGDLVSSVPDQGVIDNLKPELSDSYEVGTDLRFFKSRLGIDVTYYDERTKNQIITLPVDQSTGFSSKLINAGLITNKGVEVLLTTVPVKTKDFTLGVNFNFAKNETVLEELAEGLPEYTFGLDVMAFPGEKMGDIRGSKYARNESGEKLVGADGTYVREDNVIVGNLQADFTGSIGIDADYKGLYLKALFSMQQGGDIVSLTEQRASTAGTAAKTDYMDRISLFAPGVKANGEPNDVFVPAQTYWGSVASITEEFVYDASYMKLKELAIGYNIPSSFLRKLQGNPLQSARLSLVGRNLFYLYKNTPGTVPDGSFLNTEYYAKAYDYVPVPNTRTLGFSLNLGF